MTLNSADQILYAKLAAAGVASIVIYWLVWKWNARFANLLVFVALVALLVFATNWDYALNNYFRVSSWNLPSN